VSDPSHEVCYRRLQREFTELKCPAYGQLMYACLPAVLLPLVMYRTHPRDLRSCKK
jgi:hypothetical protein